MRIRRKLRAALTGLLVTATALTVAVAVTTPAWAAGSGNQWRYQQAWLNAWGGGPWVKVYDGSGVVNNDFTLINNAGGWQLEFTGNGYSGYCIGDAYNDPNNPNTSLNPCGGIGGGSAGWGTLFDVSQPCGPGSYAFRNRHWSQLNGQSDYLAVQYPSYYVGQPFRLNAVPPYCFAFYPPAP